MDTTDIRRDRAPLPGSLAEFLARPGVKAAALGASTGHGETPLVAALPLLGVALRTPLECLLVAENLDAALEVLLQRKAAAIGAPDNARVYCLDGSVA